LHFTEGSELFQQVHALFLEAAGGGRGGRNRESVPNVAHKKYKFQTSKILKKHEYRSNYVVTYHCHDIAVLVFDLKLHTKQGKLFLLKKQTGYKKNLPIRNNTVSYLYDPSVFVYITGIYSIARYDECNEKHRMKWK
jgi:hypothetical protein